MLFRWWNWFPLYFPLINERIESLCGNTLWNRNATFTKMNWQSSVQISQSIWLPSGEAWLNVDFFQHSVLSSSTTFHSVTLCETVHNFMICSRWRLIQNEKHLFGDYVLTGLKKNSHKLPKINHHTLLFFFALLLFPLFNS